MKVTYEQLLNPTHMEAPSAKDVDRACGILAAALAGTDKPGPAIVFFPWDTLDGIVRDVFCYNGGDEDWLAVSKPGMTPPSWLDHYGDPDTYVIAAHDIVVYVISHS